MDSVETQSIKKFLCQLPTFQNLSDADLEKAATCIYPISLAKGQYLFKAGDSYKETVYILRKGTVELRHESGEIFTLGPGEFFGLANFLDASPYTSTVVAITLVEVLSIPINELHNIERGCPILFNGINRLIAGHIRDRTSIRHVTFRALSQPARAVMKSPLAVCRQETSLLEAYTQMRLRKIGSMGVVDETDNLVGLLTLPAIADAVLIQGKPPTASVLEIAIGNPVTVRPENPLWQVEELQQDRGVKYIVVTENNKPLGMISQTDILHNFILNQGIFTEIIKSTSFTTLATQYHQIARIAIKAQENNHRASGAVKTISGFHLAIQRRCIELTINEMENEGLGLAPAPYALLILGSGGRKEMLLNPDQDNAIIIADEGLKTEDNKRWFQTFCQRVNHHLGNTGYALCPGNIMAKNLHFQKSLSQWKNQLSYIIQYPTQKSARWANIFLDFDTLYGEDDLTVELRKHVDHELKQNHALLKMMVEDDAEGQPPLGLFNRLITRKDADGKGKIDIKRSGLRIIANVARIYALKHGINSHNTIDRLADLVRQGILTGDFMRSISLSFEELLDLLLDHQIRQMQDQKKVDKLIDPRTLPPLHHESLRMAMLAIKKFQEKLQTEFDTVIF